jgi:hypothetical protein
MAGLMRGISTTCGFMRPALRAGGRSILHLVSLVNKRNDLSAYALRNGERPVYPPASVSSGLGRPRAGIRGVVFSKLSKQLNQEDALSAPWLQHFRNYCGAIKVARFGPIA